MNRRERAILAEKFEMYLEHQREILHAMERLTAAVEGIASAATAAAAVIAESVSDVATGTSGALADATQAISDVADEARTANLIASLTVDPSNVRQASIPTVAVVQERLGIRTGVPTQRSNQ